MWVEQSCDYFEWLVELVLALNAEFIEKMTGHNSISVIRVTRPFRFPFRQLTPIYILVRRQWIGTTGKYSGVAQHEYRDTAGSTIKVVSHEKAIWISASKQTVNQVSKLP